MHFFLDNWYIRRYIPAYGNSALRKERKKMSTRCQIKLKDSENNIHIYKHSDGYPSDVLPTLVPFVKRFFDNRGYDPEYLLCQIIRVFAVRDYKHSQKITDPIYKVKEGNNFYCRHDYLGWGLDCVEHGDIDYLYEIDSEGKVYVNGKIITEDNYNKLVSINN
jgi:hypothetical protein